MSGAGQDDRDDGFLGRWSRRKREAASKPGEPDVATAPDSLPPACGGEGLGMGGRKAGLDPSSSGAPSGTAPHPTLPTASGGRAEHELAQAEPEVEPPSLDLVDKDFDLAHWLKQNVPESWKRAALRRAWESDPAISGYLDPARDYALDWNTPGGAPGYGPLTESDNVEEMIANIFGKEPEKPAESAASGEPGMRDDAAEIRLSSNEDRPDPLAAPQQETGALPVPPEPVRRSDTPESVKADENPGEPPQSAAASLAAVQGEPWPPLPAGRQRRRGGSATPL